MIVPGPRSLVDGVGEEIGWFRSGVDAWEKQLEPRSDSKRARHRDGTFDLFDDRDNSR
jgi:hypothetical protein